MLIAVVGGTGTSSIMSAGMSSVERRRDVAYIIDKAGMLAIIVRGNTCTFSVVVRDSFTSNVGA